MDPRNTCGRIIKRLIEHCNTQNIIAVGLMVSEKIFVCFSYCKYMGANVPWGGANLYTRGIIGRIYVKHHIILLHTKYTSFGSCGFREDLSRDARKPVFGASDQVRHKPVCAVSKYGKKLEISDLGRREIVLSEWRNQRR